MVVGYQRNSKSMDVQRRMGPSGVRQALGAVFITAALFATSVEGSKMTACYFTNWSQYRTGVGKFLPSNVDPTLCTHVFFAFAKINEAANTIAPIEWNYNRALHPGILKLKETNPSLKLVLSVGGANALASGWLSASGEDKVAEFSTNVINYVRSNKFDGVDIDWETPTATTQANYIRLMKGLRDAINQETLSEGQDRLLLATDVVVNKDHVPYYTAIQLAQAVDYVLIMAYDFYGFWSRQLGHHSPLYTQSFESTGSTFSQHQAVEMWRNAGVPLEKMVLGIAAYGRALLLENLSQHDPGDSYNGEYPAGAPFTNETGFYAYYEACKFQEQGDGTEEWMEKAQVPYVYGSWNNQSVWIGYDNPRSVTEKTEYALSRNMSGVMLWALDFDDFTGTVCGQGHTYPLLRAMYQVVQNMSTGTTPSATGTTSTPASSSKANDDVNDGSRADICRASYAQSTIACFVFILVLYERL